MGTIDHHHTRPTTGRVTIPTQAGFAEQTAVIAERWGADAIRNSDGTALDQSVLALGKTVYSTFFPARAHDEFTVAHQDQCPQMYLLSHRVMATSPDPVRIVPLEGFAPEQFRLNIDDDPATWWEVIDRTTGEVVPPTHWQIGEDGTVTIPTPIPFHAYTVSFLAFVIWDPVEMYNHITNGWHDKPHDIPLDFRHHESWEHMVDAFSDWLATHEDVDVVRFTTFFYQFTLVFDDANKEKMVDWLGYGATISPAALTQFEQVKGYRLRPEDFVDEGYYNSTFRPPSRAFLDYIDFTSEAVTAGAKVLVDMAHAAGRQAMMFLGDQWIGMEPYSDRFAGVGLDAVVGSVGDGTTLRIISDIESVSYREGRFLPYFFPDTFHEGGEPAKEASENWLKSRRAMLRRPLDRIGYGGYLSLASQFPDFVDEVERICAEFRGIHDHINGTRPWTSLKVAMLDSWGKARSWQSFTVAHGLPHEQTLAYAGVLEALSGLPVDMCFLSFDDVLRDGIDPTIDVIINAGPAGTAQSGGTRWCDERLVTILRQWVHAGGGLIGIGEPTATAHQGRYFQLAECFGVDRELCYSLSNDMCEARTSTDHFVTADTVGEPNLASAVTGIYALDTTTSILAGRQGDVRLAAHDWGDGRCVYATGLPYSVDNVRLLYRALLWAAGQDERPVQWMTSNPACELHAYPEAGMMCLTNLADCVQTTIIYRGTSEPVECEIAAQAIIWMPMEG